MFSHKKVTLKLNIMKNSILKYGLLVFISGVFVGCDTDEANDQTTEPLNQEEVELTAKVDNATEVISDTFLQIYEVEESLVKSPIHPFLPECALVTVEITNTSKEVTVDFGTEGCEVRGGNVLKGIVKMSYVSNIDESTLVINYELVDFFINEVEFEGAKTITRQSTNENGNPQYAMNLDLSITFEDGSQASRKGTKEREWIEGSFNGNWGDNVFLITGEWETNFVNGNVHSTTIVEPIRREASCKFIVSGIVNLVRTNYSGMLNYGDGVCDNKAVFTNVDGDEQEIQL